MSALTPDETILGLLAVQAQHGYDLLETFRQPAHLGRVWKLSTSQLYNVLKRLENNGWITGEEIITESGPPRTEYALSAAGKRRLEAWLHDSHPSPSIRRVRVEFLSRLYIARELNLPTQDIVTQQRAACREELARLEAERACVEPGIDFLTLELVIAQTQAVLQWIDRCEMLPRSEDKVSVD